MSVETTRDVACDCKAGRVAAAYGLDDLDDELERRWLGEGRERESLRSLADYANRRVLRSAMRDAGMEVIDGEVENTYRLLTDSDTSAGDRTQVERRLERAGVDVDAVESDFVSHQTVHTHLRECRDVSREEADRDRVESARRTIFSLQSRTEAVVEDSLSRLAGDELALDDVDAFVDIQVVCEACGRQQEVGALIDRGGCTCQLD
ncbi:rod-determining factor RdfA [Halocalculus aciditolerans]|uniref:Uncharacterized protein n=1 Tax=Halocalculus aciditolerans TaxID=1383812 RepID=A0A830F594_9EURY|nr:rod-determining factor RdfA [Halocalculus aciditolerans]GGL64726.1 hypothetical protein GCM10009039_23380 [Halocalculus aciditolerans]